MAYGDHLIRSYPGFDHHGIDLGDGTVIEYGGKASGLPRVRRIHILAFANGGSVQIRSYTAGTALPPAQTVALAWARLREQRYDVFDNNCEHFATWCKTGRPVSPQADQLKSALSLSLFVGAAVLAAKYAK